MDEFDTLAGFMEHVSLVMDAESEEGTERVNLMTLHSAKGLEFDVVFLPGWDEGLLRISAASTRPAAQGSKRSGGSPMRADPRAAQGQDHLRPEPPPARLVAAGIPSRFIDELPLAHVEVAEDRGFHGSYGQGRFDSAETFFASGFYETPGWQRAQRKAAAKHALFPTGTRTDHHRRTLVAASRWRAPGSPSGMRVFHQEVPAWPRRPGRRQQAHSGLSTRKARRRWSTASLRALLTQTAAHRCSCNGPPDTMRAAE